MACLKKENIMIRQKNGALFPYSDEKILKAVTKSAVRSMVTFSEKEEQYLLSLVYSMVLRKGADVIDVSEMHVFVENALRVVNFKVAETYSRYRDHKQEWSSLMAECFEKANTIQYLGSKENANADDTLVSTKRSLILNEFNKLLYEVFFMTEEEKSAHDDGYIYIHDMSARRDTINCCLFDLATVLKGGFYSASKGGMWYNEPSDLDKFGDVAGDVIMMAAGQQYGGFTVCEIDKIMEPYAEKTYRKSFARFEALGLPVEICEREAMHDVEEQMRGCFQGWEYKFNTVSSSRGDYPFISFTYGLATGRFGKLASIICSETRMNGQGRKGVKKPVLFPKLIFLYDETLHGENGPLEDVFEAAVSCSQKCMYPDWLSLTGKGGYGTVPYMYKNYGVVVSPMGCRAFLSPWFERGGMYPADETDKAVTVGRFNIGVVSLHLPMIYEKARREGKEFFEVLDYYLDLIRRIHVRTYAYLGELKASSNPLAYCEGGFFGGYLDADDCIEPLLDSATAAFGITALNELQRLHNGKSLVENREFALETMRHINEVIDWFKKEDGRLYAVYGPPAENLCGKQVEQFRKMYGIIPYVSDRAYVSNSFHCHVTEDITPVEKQDIESEFFDYFRGGRIQYCRYPIDYNRKAVTALIRRAMGMGLYEGINMSLATCEECGFKQLEMSVCPRCGSKNITKIDRMNGYLQLTQTSVNSTANARTAITAENYFDVVESADTGVQGTSRSSVHKNQEISDRVSM